MTPASCAIVIPTFQRLDGLSRALQSVFDQHGITLTDVVIVDNDPTGSARETTQSFIAAAPDFINVKYVHEPAPGVANARNTALAATDARLIAFLDDDQSARKDWLANLLLNHSKFGATVTFGPVDADLPAGTQAHAAYLSHFFSRTPAHPSGLIEDAYGCGNALLDRDQITLAPPLFDTAMNQSGGEDDVLFGLIQRAGGTFAWCEDARVHEHVPADRAQLSYTLKRAFSYGQGPITNARKQTPPRWDLVALWMLIGSGKFLLNGAIYLAQRLTRLPNQAEYLDRAVRGLGKVWWWKELNFYGQSRLD